MTTSQPIVYVVEDDRSVRTSIGQLCEEMGYRSELCASPAELQIDPLLESPACLVLDVRFPGIAPTGLELRRTLTRKGIMIPTVFISGYADVRIAVDAMKEGAIDFLAKPFREQDLLDAIRTAIQCDVEHQKLRDHHNAVNGKIRSLTHREHQIMILSAGGLVAKQIAANLGISEVTAKLHRAKMMKKLGVRTAVELSRLVDSLHHGEIESRSSGFDLGHQERPRGPIPL